MSAPRRVNIESFQCQGNYLSLEVWTPRARALHAAQSEEDTAAVAEARPPAAGWVARPPVRGEGGVLGERGHHLLRTLHLQTPSRSRERLGQN